MKYKTLLKACNLFYKTAIKKEKNPILKDWEDAGKEHNFKVEYVDQQSIANGKPPFHIRKYVGNEFDRGWSHSFQFEDEQEAIKTANSLHYKTHEKYIVVDSLGVWRYIAESEDDKREERRRKIEEAAYEKEMLLQDRFDFGDLSPEHLSNNRSNKAN